MTPFVRLTGIAAPLPIANIDTDMLVPAPFLKTVSRQGLGGALFHNQRFDELGQERLDFVINRAPWREAKILITLENFGCGSSREHAPWALLDFGIRCIIAPSFADIFHSNCCKNGILPIELDRAIVEDLMERARDPARATFTVDLEALTITTGDREIPFAVDEQRRTRLLEGIDDIANSLHHEAAISAHEERARREMPWLVQTGLLAWRNTAER
ncbi:3-isopropylmalate dehydratase small subunit [Terricaulis silvestris]|uniref:3-isopropylmalate dehydratase small subunit n=1 Tax=Terricaulis silvestris TaxID=2686094 RepID=A0A6I6MKV0_9CAUL|nr:3-isopropylmalate dehydratase small subunit [Terricaulis silvestris]QGZ93786.1 3-isopropylmalate dehydratase small subunit [Terricaulis silvestris]